MPIKTHLAEVGEVPITRDVSILSSSKMAPLSALSPGVA